MFCRIAAAALEFLFLVAISPAINAQTPLPPGVGIQIEAMPKIGTVGDPIQIDLDITLPSGYRVDIPGLEQQVGDFSIIEFFPGPAIPETDKSQKLAKSPQIQDGSLQHHRARIIAAVYKTGRLTFPSIQFILHTPEGKNITLSSPPANIEIQSVLTEKDQSLKDLKKQAEIREPIRWALWLTIALACCILGATVWLLWRRYRKRPQPVPSIPTLDPFDLAEADLRELLAGRLLENGSVKKFYILLSEIVKRILESGYSIHTAERTTSEIMDSLSQCPRLKIENLTQIESFLLQCDVVKFAKYLPSTGENDTAADDAFRILAEARKAMGSRQWAVGSGQ